MLSCLLTVANIVSDTEGFLALLHSCLNCVHVISDLINSYCSILGLYH